MKTFRQITWTVLTIIGFLTVWSQMANAASIYDIDGLFAPSLKYTASSNFTGKVTFPGPTVQSGVLEVVLAADPATTRVAPFNMALNLPGTMFQPWDTRLFAGSYEGAPFTMLALDYDQTAGLTLDSGALDQGGGWDAWLVSFNDWPAGSIAHMAQVNEPSAMALGAVAFVFLLGFLRSINRR